MSMRWSKETIAAEILRRHSAGQDLSYSGITREYLALLRAAARHFGGWEAAIEFAGLDYDTVRRYRAWTAERIVERIRTLYAEGADLSWRHIALHLDPSLAAAAVKKAHFGSWRAALTAAGLDYDTIRRYRDWSDEEIVRSVQERHRAGLALNAKRVEREDVPLITAARRRFPSWDGALSAAGLDVQGIVLRPARRATRKDERNDATTSPLPT
jgi:hypothetical protein